MVFIAITLSESCIGCGNKRLTLKYLVTEVYYLNKALALFNTGACRMYYLKDAG
jgi:hypothetical protein